MAQTPKQLANLRPPWKKGERGNPHYAGRAKGSRNKINRAWSGGNDGRTT